MKYFFTLFVLTILMFSCQQKAAEPRQKTYYINRANLNNVRGEAVFEELAPGKIKVVISLTGISPEAKHPAHLHFGSVREVGELAFALNPVDGATGNSVTILDQVELSNGEPFTYELLDEMNGSIKIHMNDNLFKHMVLAFGNIGKNEDYFFDGVAVCTGH
ncbi:MAG: hypothetical protein ABJG41_04795 [Cyclobacteriaceae bacterium]